MADDSEDSDDPPEESKNENEEIENGPDAIPADETSKRWDGDEERLTCDAFDTQEDAQAYFDENPEERGYLDQNNNGAPCESLPSDNKGGDNGDEGDTGNNGDGEAYPALLRG